MNRFLQILLSSLLTGSFALADTNSYISRQLALSCIQLNKDMNLASQQMLSTESSKTTLTSKINYLQGQITQRRDKIRELDQRNTQSNNKNYNQLVTQFEDLLEERRQAITEYERQNQLHVTQHKSVVRLEQRFSDKCLDNIQITQELHKEVCQLEDIRWCNLFKF